MTGGDAEAGAPVSPPAAVLDEPVRDRLAGLAAFHRLPADAPARLGALLQALAEDPTAPTTVTNPALAADAHVADSLVALELPVVRAASAVADLGAGAGFPGLVLAIALPDTRVSLVESARRKCVFLERAVARAGIGNAQVVHARAEAWPEGLGRHDLVTVRALAPLAVLAEYSAPLLAIGGGLVAWKGRRDEVEEAAGADAAQQLGLEPTDVVEVHPFAEAQHRHLHVYRKIAETPAGFPRRPGRARSHPLA